MWFLYYSVFKGFWKGLLLYYTFSIYLSVCLSIYLSVCTKIWTIEVEIIEIIKLNEYYIIHLKNS